MRALQQQAREAQRQAHVYVYCYVPLKPAGVASVLCLVYYKYQKKIIKLAKHGVDQRGGAV